MFYNLTHTEAIWNLSANGLLAFPMSNCSDGIIVYLYVIIGLFYVYFLLERNSNIDIILGVM